MDSSRRDLALIMSKAAFVSAGGVGSIAPTRAARKTAMSVIFVFIVPSIVSLFYETVCLGDNTMREIAKSIILFIKFLK
jgi:hypothetical protein